MDRPKKRWRLVHLPFYENSKKRSQKRIHNVVSRGTNSLKKGSLLAVLGSQGVVVPRYYLLTLDMSVSRNYRETSQACDQQRLPDFNSNGLP